jgi:hypothetical protein
VRDWGSLEELNEREREGKGSRELVGE